ncbi:hypothetical protein [Azohydromonas caseinilytica]|uniref:Uncharacterized protein n=1 Tax=Azohydromonas caseinilytica TaxID=2728836 RepID=A0A848FDV4_9BURK|nr:hypothetical protein [Azohydromonas caseinilytica]NML16995.1 hypothetical protein [Azohydromonas caseinilytica]
MARAQYAGLYVGAVLFCVSLAFGASLLSAIFWGFGGVTGFMGARLWWLGRRVAAIRFVCGYLIVGLLLMAISSR